LRTRTIRGEEDGSRDTRVDFIDEGKVGIRGWQMLAEFNMMLTATASSAHNAGMNNPSVKRYAWLSIFAALATLLLTGFARWMKGSVGRLSDALGSIDCFRPSGASGGSGFIGGYCA